MKNISDIIENHLKLILEKSKTGYVEIQRSDLADQFQCVPSQINYVINTRFTVERGYLVQSKRGGGGYIRIRKIQLVSEQEFMQNLLDKMNNEVPQATAEHIVDRLREAKLVTEREWRLMKTVLSRNILSFDMNTRDQLRARLLKAMIISLMYK